MKTIVVDGGIAIYALIVRGTDAGDEPNPLFRLDHRSLLDRLRITGLLVK